MKYHGINYDIGTQFTKGKFSRETFDLNVVQKEIEIIKNELHCNAIRISGQEIVRLSQASEIALKLGLTVFFSPAYINATQQETLDYLSQCALAAEKLRLKYPNLIFVIGCELSLFIQGFIRGDDIYIRLKRMFNFFFIVKKVFKIKSKFNRKLNDFLKEAVSMIKGNFSGQITYASGTWEEIDWTLFDIIGIDHYRAFYNKSTYRKEMHPYMEHGKPVVVTEFGCCTYKGAEDAGGGGWAIIDWTKPKPELKKEYTRDEGVQANYILELLDIFQEEKIAGALVFTFVNPVYAYNEDPRYDLDMASYSVVKTFENPQKGSYKDMPWVPKKAFYKLAEYYAKINNYQA